MRALWTLVRIVILIACIYTLIVVPIFSSSPSGTGVEIGGVVIDAIAIVVASLVGWSLWRGRRSLV